MKKTIQKKTTQLLCQDTRSSKEGATGVASSDIINKIVRTRIRTKNQERKTVYQPGLYVTLVKRQDIGKGNVQNWRRKRK